MSVFPSSPSARVPTSPAAASRYGGPAALRASTSRLSAAAVAGGARAGSAGSSGSSKKAQIREALGVALEVAASPRAQSRRDTSDLLSSEAPRVPSLNAAVAAI